MAITTLDQLKAAYRRPLLVQFYRDPGNQQSAAMMSAWSINGVPNFTANPTTAVILNNTTAGVFNVAARSGETLYLAGAKFTRGDNTILSGTALYVVDRLVHMGGLSGIVITPQTVGISCDQTASNFVARRGDYERVEWVMEVYANLGATAATLTVNYTTVDDVSGSTTIAVPGTARRGRTFPVIPTAGHIIKSIDSCQLSVSTTGTGNFGFTAYRWLTSVVVSGNTYGLNSNSDWQQTLTKIEDQAALFPYYVPLTSTSTALSALFEFVSG